MKKLFMILTLIGCISTSYANDITMVSADADYGGSSEYTGNVR